MKRAHCAIFPVGGIISCGGQLKQTSVKARPGYQLIYPIDLVVFVWADAHEQRRPG
jgi:hypothetical protein